jgi:acyl-CoA synthetase (AMP-forming)/AMP-acid ligase II
MAMVSLVPSEAELPDSSLAFMIARAAETLAEGPVLEAMFPRTGLDFDALRAGFETAAARGEPLLLLGTAFAFVHLLDRCEREGIAFVLPEGSRIMDTGGFKGRSREVARGELLAAYRERLGIPETHVVSEYGMTELCSQFYEPVLADRISGNRAADGGRVFVGPPWVRTRVLDPETLAELRPGEPGLLCHFDLANAWTVSAVLTEDLGVAAGRGFRVLGRARGAELRGCSLAAEAILER